MYLITTKMTPEERSQNPITHSCFLSLLPLPAPLPFCKFTFLLLEAHYVLLATSCQRKSESAATSCVSILFFLSFSLSFSLKSFLPRFFARQIKGAFLLTRRTLFYRTNTPLRVFLRVLFALYDRVSIPQSWRSLWNPKTKNASTRAKGTPIEI